MQMIVFNVRERQQIVQNVMETIVCMWMGMGQESVTVFVLSTTRVLIIYVRRVLVHAFNVREGWMIVLHAWEVFTKRMGNVCLIVLIQHMPMTQHKLVNHVCLHVGYA